MFFFFKQKTSYEMRISDWSSDVCSSDLHERGALRGAADPVDEHHARVALVGRACAHRVDLGTVHRQVLPLRSVSAVHPPGVGGGVTEVMLSETKSRDPSLKSTWRSQAPRTRSFSAASKCRPTTEQRFGPRLTQAPP